MDLIKSRTGKSVMCVLMCSFYLLLVSLMVILSVESDINKSNIVATDDVVESNPEVAEVLSEIPETLEVEAVISEMARPGEPITPELVSQIAHKLSVSE